MSQEKPEGRKYINNFVIKDLEVCGLEDSKFIDLPKVFTHTSIPVSNGNIPNKPDFQKWSYMHEV